MSRYFEYGEEAVGYLRARDAKLAAAMDAVGHVYREMEEADLFAAATAPTAAWPACICGPSRIWMFPATRRTTPPS